MDFETDVFLSYAHIDNKRPLSDDDSAGGWVTDLHQALQNRLSQLLGQESRIWRDPKLQGNDVFADTLIERLRSVAALVSVLSPAYVKSEWCQKELAEFCRCAQAQLGITVGDKSRVFKVIKTPVPLEQHPSSLQSLLGYEFFRRRPDSGKVEEFNKIFGKHAEIDFWIKLDDLAQDICALLNLLGKAPAVMSAPKSTGGAVYLALTPPDLDEERSAIKRDLEQHGFTVLPGSPFAGDAAAWEAAIRQDLARSRLSVHMIGGTYVAGPSGSSRSLFEVQNALAAERAATGAFSRLIWIRPNLTLNDPRQQKVIEQLRLDPQMPKGTDLLETSLEDLKTIISAWLSGEVPTPAAAPAAAAAGGGYPQLYCVYDTRDVETVAPWEKLLFDEFEVIRPVLQGDGADIRNANEDALRNCDGVLIFFGAAGEFWLRQKIREVQKSPGYGRTKPLPVVGVCLVPPETPEKSRFATHDALVVSQLSGVAPTLLQPFVARVKEVRSTDQGNAGQTAG